MDRRKFEQLVAKAVETLPEDLLDEMENVDIVVADIPTREQGRILEDREDEMLLGLYEGIPLTERTYSYGFVMPDKISVFKNAIESICHSEQEIVDEVRRVVIHEIAHHFGIDDARLDELGWG
jgi:predicted Zn-dependent protease with MMP-like domain